MKDRDSIELVKGDLIMVTIDTPVENPTEIVMFKEMKTEVTSYDSNNNPLTTKTLDTLVYYPLRQEGLQVARDDEGVAQTDTFYRTDDFEATNIKSKHLLKISENLVGKKKEVYDAITAIL